MASLKHLLERNRQWADNLRARQPGFFEGLAEQQAPRYLWIGCSDSRVTANDIIELPAGELFVHRNVANVVVHTDLNCLSVLQYAVEALKVEHVIVVGHYGCGGINAAFRGVPLGLIDNWLRHVQDVAVRHKALLDSLPDDAARVDRLCELNVIEQLMNVGRTSIIQDAWRRNQTLTLHGWIYRLHDGLVHDLGVESESPAELDMAYREAIAQRMPASYSTPASPARG